MSGTGHHEHEEELERQAISLRDLARVLSGYRRAILSAVLAVGFIYLLVALTLSLLGPRRTVTEVPFRLEFQGSDTGQYPNGMIFSVSDIISTPTLRSVYDKNGLKDFVDYETFKNSVSVTESNPALEALEREYRAKLSEPKLAAVDRARLEEEFRQKKASMRRSEYAISYISASRTKDLTPAVKVKALGDILTAWADRTVQNTGVVLYDLPILSSAIFERDILAKYDYIIAVDILRSKIERILSNIQELSAIPGAKVARTPAPSRASLAELRVRLEDALRFKLEPLTSSILGNGLSKSPRESIGYFETRLRFNEIERREVQARVETLRRALETYQQRTVGTARETTSVPQETVVSQMDSTFFDRVLALSGEKSDMVYRQSLVNSMQAEDLKLAPLQAEEQYYTVLISSLRRVDARAREAGPAEMTNLSAATTAVVDESIAVTDQVNQIYRTISENLNPSRMLFTTTSPPVTRTERAYPFEQLLLVGLLLLILTVPLAAAGALLHNAMARGGEEVVSSAHSDAISAGSSARAT